MRRRAFRGIYGPCNGPGSTISGLRGVWVGWIRCAAETAAIATANGLALVAREPANHEAGEVARDGRTEVVPGGARSGVSEASAGAG